MNQSKFSKYVVALLVFLVATSCRESTNSTQERTEGFKALVMGGKDIDLNQTWSTATNTSVNVTVNLQADEQYNVYIYQNHPASSSSAAHLGMATLNSGESRTIYVAKPIDASQLYAACYDSQNHVICLPVTNGKVTFSGNITTSTGVPTNTTGNNWSVPYQATPDVSKYTSEPLTEVTDLDPNLPTDAEARVKISQTYSGFIPFLTSHTNMSVYVTSTWTLTFDQRLNSGNVIVVGNGGKIVIPKGFKLSTSPLGDGSTSGRIYVLPGGEISGQGTVEFSSESDFNYIAGTVATDEIDVASGTLYNNGTIGSSASGTKLAGTSTTSTPATFINLGTTNFSDADGTNLTIMNAGYMIGSGNLTLAHNARMDDYSTLSCGSLTLQGDGNATLYMGNGAYLNCKGNISVSNYGVWGPSGSKYKANARLRVGGCGSCKATSGNANDYLLDHVQVEVPIGATGLDLLSPWVNGTDAGIEEARQTCFYVIEGTVEKPSENYLYYCFEAPDGYAVKDYDYNDVVLTVTMPYEDKNGVIASYVDVIAVGTTLETYVYLNGEQLGEEVHAAMGVATKETCNTNSVTKSSRRLGMITFSSNDVNINHLNFTLKITSNNGSSSTQSQPAAGTDNAPLFIMVNGDQQGKWRWIKEGCNIGLAYPQFIVWAANAQTALDWYHSSNASSHQVVSW